MNKRMLVEVYRDARLTQEEIEMMSQYIEGSKEFYGTSAYDKLYEYFAFNTNEMPYGVAKARTGDPDAWIIDKLAGENQESSSFLDKLKHLSAGG